MKMKNIRTILLVILCFGFMFSTISCAVFVRKDNGRHNGWNKRQNNPHHRKTTKPGKYKNKKRHYSFQNPDILYVQDIYKQK